MGKCQGVFHEYQVVSVSGEEWQARLRGQMGQLMKGEGKESTLQRIFNQMDRSVYIFVSLMPSKEHCTE